MISALVTTGITSGAFGIIATIAAQIAFKLIKRWLFSRI